MRTKYILHGGFTPGELQVNNAFFKEILKDATNTPKILLEYFAKEVDRVEKNRDEDIEQFNNNSDHRTLVFETASDQDFVEQVKKADIVYLHGGHSGRLLEALKKYPGLKQLFEGKIIAGDSAGANVLAECFYSMKIGITEGLGLLPIKLICHFKEENKEKLKDVKPGLETIFLPEYYFKVIISE